MKVRAKRVAMAESFNLVDTLQRPNETNGTQENTQRQSVDRDIDDEILNSKQKVHAKLNITVKTINSNANYLDDKDIMRTQTDEIINPNSNQ